MKRAFADLDPGSVRYNGGCSAMDVPPGSWQAANRGDSTGVGVWMLLSEAVEAYVTDRSARAEISLHSANVLRWRLFRVVRVVGDREVAELGPEEVGTWVRSIGWQRPASRKAQFSTLRVFCRWLLEEGLIEGDPTLRLHKVREPQAVPRALSPVQLARLALVLPNHRARAIVALQSRLGLRCAEVANLQVSDWSRVGGTLLVRGKFGHERRLPVPPDVAMVLSRHLDGRRAGPLVGSSAHVISKQVSTWMNRAGIKAGPRDGMSAHALRHTAASDLYAATHDVRLAQRLLGHANIATTDRYLRPGDLDELRAALGDEGRPRPGQMG